MLSQPLVPKLTCGVSQLIIFTEPVADATACDAVFITDVTICVVGTNHSGREPEPPLIKKLPAVPKAGVEPKPIAPSLLIVNFCVIAPLSILVLTTN